MCASAVQRMSKLYSEKVSCQGATEDAHVVVCRLDDNLLGIPVDCLPNPPAVQALKAERP